MKEREQYKCPKCGTVVSGIYILVVSKNVQSATWNYNTSKLKKA